MSDYLYYCAKCNSLIADKYKDDDVTCDDCWGRMTPLHITEDDWNDLSDEEKSSVIAKYKSPQSQVKKKRSVITNSPSEPSDNKASQRINLCELIIQAISIMLLFIPGMFYWEHWENEGEGIDRLRLQMSISYFHAAKNIAIVLGVLILALMIANVVIMLVELFNPSKTPNRIIQIILSIMHTVLFFVFAIIASRRDDYGYCATINVLFYIEALLLLSIIVLAFLKTRQN